jgi:type IV secretion system protein VirD4
MEAIMSATKILWGQIIAVLLIVLAATWGASEWTAWRLGFQPELGSPWFSLLGWPVHHPPIFYWWWYAYDAYAPDVFTEGGCIAASGGILADRRSGR